MRVLTKDEINLNKGLFFSIMRHNLFIYPTDTIYGIGCNATNLEAVQRVRELKQSPEQPFSIIAPNKNWIKEHCIITPEAEEWLQKLPGPYTLILKLKQQNSIAANVSPGRNTIGVRMPNHWIMDKVNAFGLPIITTSANITGENFMTDSENLSQHIKQEVDFLIDDGKIEGRPSTLVHLETDEVFVKQR